MIATTTPDPAVRTTSPVLIGGAERSGTSLMYALLASHPELSMARRTNLWRWFDGRFGSLADPADRDRAVDTMSRYERLSPLEPDWGRVRRELDEDPSYATLFDALHRHHALRQGRSRWGDKSLHTELHAARVFATFPQARIIHLVRDPRDRFASIANRGADHAGGAPKGLAAATGRWICSARAAVVNQSRHRGRYMVVRYEDLVTHPRATAEAVCAFIGERFEPSMLALAGAPDHRGGNSSFEDLAPATISTAPIGRFRDALAPRDIACIQLLAGRTMRRLGYRPERVPLGAARVRVALVDAPREAARVAAWRARERATRGRETVPVHRLAEADR